MAKITVVVDNVPFHEIKGEWGLSIWIEHNGKNILLDAGASNLFEENLIKLGKDIRNVDYAVLSHAHFDHANGLPRFLELNEKAKLFVQKDTACDCYYKKFFIKKYLGIPKSILDTYGNRVEKVFGDYKLMEGAYLISHKTEGLASIGKRENMYRKTNHGYKPDDFSHEQSLVLDTKKGLVILNSCSHGGAANIIREVAETFPDKHVYGLIGGFHLFNKSEAEIKMVSRLIKDTGIDFVCTGHCTKQRAYDIMKAELGDRLCMLRVGLELEM